MISIEIKTGKIRSVAKSIKKNGTGLIWHSDQANFLLINRSLVDKKLIGVLKTVG